MDEILKTAGWSSTRSFDRFYDKPVSFGSAVLHADLTLVEFILTIGFFDHLYLSACLEKVVLKTFSYVSRFNLSCSDPLWSFMLQYLPSYCL